MIGSKFGRLIVLKAAEGLKKGNWLCECSCGNQKVYTGAMLRAGRAQSCGRCFRGEDLTGKQVNKLTVLHYDSIETREHLGLNSATWTCICECGEIVHRRTTDLKNNLAFSCKKCQGLKDISGERVGNLTAIKREPNGDWKLICDCGNEKLLSVSEFHSGNYKTCGDQNCTFHKQAISQETSIHPGDIFGDLTIVERDKDKWGQPAWNTKCKCGNEEVIASRDLKQRGRICCSDCLPERGSRGERTIAKILRNLNIAFQREVKFPDLFYKDSRTPLRFDFGIYKNDDLLCLIEFDGEQHQKEVEFFKGAFEDTKNRDKLKDLYCQNHKIKLFRIAYNKINDLDSEIKHIIESIAGGQ